MFDAITYRLGRRRALQHLRDRTVQPWNPSPAARKVLVVLPAGEEAAKEGWRFVKSLGLPPKQLIPVVLPGEVTYVPAEFVRFMRRLEADDMGRLGLVKSDIAEGVWGEEPDLAFSLIPEFDLAASHLVGASPAQLRVGFYDAQAEPFFDVMVSSNTSTTSAFTALRDTLQRIVPPVLDLSHA